MADFDLVAPASVEEAIAALRTMPDGEATPIAGGTDLLFDLESGRTTPRRVVSLRRLPWRTLDWSAGALTIGSTLPLSALEEDPEVRERLPALAQAVSAVGSPALRHRATLGGNLVRAAPASDLLPVLLALDATVELVGPDGERAVEVDRFLRSSRRTELRSGELVRSVRCPEPRPSAYYWQRVRPANDISQVAVAVAWSPTGARWRVAVAGVLPRPVLVPEAAGELGGPAPTLETARRAGAMLARRATFVTDRRASEEYRRRLVATLFVRAVAASVAPGVANG